MIPILGLLPHLLLHLLLDLLLNLLLDLLLTCRNSTNKCNRCPPTTNDRPPTENIKRVGSRLQ
jgi:hypothetical protein